MAAHNIETADFSLISSDEIFILDANILCYLYSGYNLNQRNAVKAMKYSNFISNLLGNGNRISTSAAYVQEVLNYIEKTEYTLYKQAHPIHCLTKKQFRNSPTFRAGVKSKTSSVYSAICQNCNDVYDVHVTKPIMDRFVNEFQNHVYDPIDYIIAENLVTNNRINIITDDKDYRNDSRLQVYTII